MSIRTVWLSMKGILRAARQAINAELEPLNLSGAEGDVLFLLLTGSDSCQQEQLAEHLDIGKAAVSRVVGSLETKGYVVRERQHNDRRAYCVSLTPKAAQVATTVQGIYNRLYERVSVGISSEEFAHIEAVLVCVSQNLQSQKADHV